MKSHTGAGLILSALLCAQRAHSKHAAPAAFIYHQRVRPDKGEFWASFIVPQVAWASSYTASDNSNQSYQAATIELPDEQEGPKIKYGPFNRVDAKTDPYTYPTPASEPVLVYPTYAAMQCTGHGYCFQDKVDKVKAVPVCPIGFTLDAKAAKCYKFTGYLCKLSIKHSLFPSKDPSKCYVCGKDEYLNSANKCEKLCKEGYDQILVKGVKHCLMKCNKGWEILGNDCVKFSAAHKPLKCDQKFCLLPGEQLYMTAASGSYDPKGKDCVCAKTVERKLYEKAQPVAATLEAAEPQYKWTEAQCPDGKAPNVFGKCRKLCPVGCSESVMGECMQACPPGMQACRGPAGQHICVTKGLVFGCDACKVINNMINDCDTSIRCPQPTVAV